MSILKIEITEQHLKLLKHLRWSINKNGFIIGTEDEDIDTAPFNENSLYEAVDLILNGKRDMDNDSFLMVEYSQTQKDEWDKLYSELPLVLSIVLQTQSFDLGKFKTKWHDINWKKIS